MQMQVGYSDEFSSIIDLLTMKMASFTGDMGSEVTWADVPEQYIAQANELRHKIIDAAANYDDELAEKFINEGFEITPFEKSADVYVINTCTVTNMGDKKSRQMTSSFFQSRMKYGFFLQKYRKIRVIIEEQEKYA